MRRVLGGLLALLLVLLLWALGSGPWASLPHEVPGPPDARDEGDAPRAEPSPLARHALARLRAGAPEEALELLERDPGATGSDLSASLLRIDLLRLTGQSERAMALGAAAAERWPRESRVRHAWAKAMGTHMQEGGVLAGLRWLGSFKQQLSKAIELDPRNVEARIDEIGFLIYAPSLVGGDLERARQMSRALRRLDDAAGAMLEALCVDREGDKPAAIRLCREALARHPAHQDLGVVLASLLEESGQPAQALEQDEQVLAGEQGEAFFRALAQRARLGLEQGRDPTLCLADLEQFLSRAPPADFMPSRASIQSLRGRVLERLDRPQEAAEAYRQALTEDPGNDTARRALSRLD